MKINFQHNKDISVLSWCLVLDKTDQNITLEHGSNIEVGNDFFVEGAWDGDFKKMDFDNSLFFLGTGGKIKNDCLILSTPNHVLERIYSIKTGEKIYFSNSLPFILKRSSCKLDKNYFDYEKSFASILKGLAKYEATIPLDNNTLLRLYYYCNIRIDKEYSVVTLQKNEIDVFVSYDDYISKTTNILKLIKQNASDFSRKVKYELITTISKGYDAAASSVLAKEIGCDTAVTFDKPFQYEVDSGEEIAALLGYTNIIKKDAREYLNNIDNIETEYISSGELGTGIVFSAFQQEFKNKVVFWGERGDKIWSMSWGDVNSDFRFTNEIYSGTSLVESRLKGGYMVLPVPLIGASHWPSIDAISRSDKMKAFSIGGEYDRPIPRRILEDAGVSRKMFGFKKYGAGFNYRFDNRKRLQSRMSPHTFNNFRREFKSNWSFLKLKHYFSYIYYTKEYYINHLLNTLKIKYRLKVSQTMYSNPTIPKDLFLWSVETMMKKY